VPGSCPSETRWRGAPEPQLFTRNKACARQQTVATWRKRFRAELKMTVSFDETKQYLQQLLAMRLEFVPVMDL